MSVLEFPERENTNFEPLSQLTAETIAGLVGEMSEQGDNSIGMVFAGDSADYETSKLIIMEQTDMQHYMYLDPITLEDCDLIITSTSVQLLEGKQVIEAGVGIYDTSSGKQIFNIDMPFDLDGNYVPEKFITEDEGFNLIKMLEDARLIDDMNQLIPQE